MAADARTWKDRTLVVPSAHFLEGPAEQAMQAAVSLLPRVDQFTNVVPQLVASAFLAMHKHGLLPTGHSLCLPLEAKHVFGNPLCQESLGLPGIDLRL